MYPVYPYTSLQITASHRSNDRKILDFDGLKLGLVCHSLFLFSFSDLPDWCFDPQNLVLVQSHDHPTAKSYLQACYIFCLPMYNLVILYTPIYPVYPCLPQSCCIPCIPLYILFTHVYPSHTVYLVYPYIISCLLMFILVILYTLCTPIYPVYPYLPQSYCMPWYGMVTLFIHGISFRYIYIQVQKN